MAVKNRENYIELRASGLPTGQDCWRKWAVKAALDPNSKLMPVLNKHGFTFDRKPGNNVGAAVGRSIHEALQQNFQAQIDGYAGVNLEQVAVTTFNKMLNANDVEFDTGVRGITKDSETAMFQIKRMVEAITPHAAQLKPKKVEFGLEIVLDPNRYLVTMHTDFHGQSDDVRDFKFGSIYAPYQAQLGTYSLGIRSAGGNVSGLFVDWLPRHSVTKDPKKRAQKPLQIVEYAIHTCEQAAHALLNEAMDKIEKFKETGDPWAFTANNQGLLCSKKWCPAWGTPFCDMGRPEKETEEEE